MCTLQKYELMKYGYDQSLMIRPETADKDEDCKSPSSLPSYLRHQSLLRTCANRCKIWSSSSPKTAAATRCSSRRLLAFCESGRSLGAPTMRLLVSRKCLIRLPDEQKDTDDWDMDDYRWTIVASSAVGASVWMILVRQAFSLDG